MASNFYMVFVIALIPLIVGAVYYNPKVVGGLWMKVNGFTEESLQGANMLVIFSLVYLFSVLIAFILIGIVIHQSSVTSLFANDLGDTSSAGYITYTSMMAEYGDRHRSFGHGAMHGAIFALFMVFPLISIVSLFERRGWKYIFVHTGYWLISLVLMGGMLCQMLKFNY